MTYDIVIIGAGIAGLTAAIYGKRAGKTVLVLEGNSYGGQIVTTPSIENYPATMGISGFDFATKIYNQTLSFGTEIKFESAMEIVDGKIKMVKTNKTEYQTKSIIIATGSKNRLLGLKNELNYIGKGVSYCATCDGTFYKNKVVAVVGGGNTALEDAIYLADLAQKVYLIHRRDEFKAEVALVDQIKAKKNIEIIYNAQVAEIIGNDKLTGINLNVNGTSQQVVLDGLFIAVGRVPENIKFANVVQLDNFGYVVAGENCETSTKGIFTAGDCRTKEIRQLVTAAGDGAVAANHAIQYVNAL